jgi:hypothetical protein
MAWTAPTDWDVGDILTAADLNKINTNLNALKTPPTEAKKGNGAGNFTTASTSFVVVDSSLNLSVTTTGGDIMIGVTGGVLIPTGLNVTFDFEVDGVRLGLYSTGGGLSFIQNNFSTFSLNVPLGHVTLATGVAVGTHSIKLLWKASAATITMYNSITSIPTFWAREV